MSDEANRDAAQRLFAAYERWDLETVASLVAPDAVEGRPQSGERFVGPANILGMLHSLPSRPQIVWRSIRGGGDVWVAEGIVEYGEGPVHLIGVLEFADGVMIKGDFYFAYPFEPPEYRARFAEPVNS
jgi:hypothetical protein